MRKYNESECGTRDICVGIDVHARQWHVTVIASSQTVFSGAIAGNWPTLQKLLLRWERARLVVAYEAGFSGFWLHDELVAWGVSCVVVPPSLIPTESGTRVKTDRWDSTKLALRRVASAASAVKTSDAIPVARPCDYEWQSGWIHDGLAQKGLTKYIAGLTEPKCLFAGIGR